MAVTAQFLKGIMAEARPIIERQMNDAKIIAGLRTVVANNGGDWGALKALIKAHVEDESDETGEGKRVQKILEKADSSTAYADMLGLANMNEKNFSAETGEITEKPETATNFTGPQLSAVPGGEPSIQSSDDGGAKTESDCNRIPGRSDDMSAHTSTQSEQAANSIPDDDVPAFLKKDRAERNERCEKPLTCQFGHHPQKVTCSTCTTAWQIARRKAVAA